MPSSSSSSPVPPPQPPASLPLLPFHQVVRVDKQVYRQATESRERMYAAEPVTVHEGVEGGLARVRKGMVTASHLLVARSGTKVGGGGGGSSSSGGGGGAGKAATDRPPFHDWKVWASWTPEARLWRYTRAGNPSLGV